MQHKRIALFDMDGTLFDYEGRLRRELQKMTSPNEECPLTSSIWDEDKPWIKARIDIIKDVPGFWKNLPRFEFGWDIYRIAKEIGFDIHILTKGPSNRPQAWAEKVQCIRHHFTPEEDIVIHLTEDKGVHYGKVLVDDYPVYIEKWLEHRPRGLVIMPVHEYNKNYSHPNVVPYHGGNIQIVEQCLKKAYERSPKEHWN